MNLPAISLPKISLPDFSDKKMLLIGAIVVVIIFLLGGLLLSLTFFRKVAPVIINMWGLWEDPVVFSEVIADYQRKNPNVTIKYAKQSSINYRDRLTAAISGVNGPDILLLHNSWLPMFRNLLAVMPTTVYSPAEYKTIFYPTVSRDFISGGNAYAVPLEIDDLAMYVNQDILTAAGVNVPVTWDGVDSFVTVAEKMTVHDAAGRITTSGTALGTASNVDHWQDIIGLIMLQAGVDLNSDLASTKAQEALGFYSSFATTERIWNETLDNSTLAFASGKVGMYFGPSWRIFDIKTLNPNLNFKVVPVPQLTGADSIDYATYWAEAVSKNSKNQKIAWDFLKFLTSREELPKLYSAQSKLRQFGEPYSRTDMAQTLLTDPNVGVFINAAPTARSWYLASFTSDGDTGINSRIGKYYADAINSMLRGAGAGVLNTVSQGVKQVLGAYPK